MPSPAEIAYRESMRSLDGQAQDLTSVRGHLSIVVSAAGIAAAFLGAQADGRGPAFWIAAGAFALVAVLTVSVYRPVDFPWGFDGYKLVTDYVDSSPQPEPDFVMRELAVHAAENYEINKATLDRLWKLQSWAFLLFVVEVSLSWVTWRWRRHDGKGKDQAERATASNTSTIDQYREPVALRTAWRVAHRP